MHSIDVRQDKIYKKDPTFVETFYMVRERGLEPPRLAALAPKASVSTNSTTRAYRCIS